MAKSKSLRKVVYEKIEVKQFVGDKALTVEKAMELIGWQSDKDPKNVAKFGDDYKFTDCEGTKIRLANCETNRPFRKGLSLEYANEMLRNKWKLNGETIIFDVRNNCNSGQHRLVALILAEQLRKKSPETWKAYGTRGPVTIECIVIFGVSDEPEVADTTDIGQKRSLGDVLFRNKEFEGPDGKALTEREQKQMTNVLANAARVVWLILGGKLVSDAPKFLHSEALDLIDEHPKLKEAVEHIIIEDAGAEKQIRNCCSMGTAAGLLYIMGACKTKTEKYAEEGSKALNFDAWEKAEEFWTLVGSGAGLEKGHPCLVLRNFLTGSSASGAHERDEIVAAIKLAWNAFFDGKNFATEGVKGVKAPRIKVKDKSVIEMPHIGGIDIHHEAPVKLPKKTAEEKKAEKEAKAAAKKAAKAAAGPKPKGKGKGKGKGPAKKIEYGFAVGDEVWVHPKGYEAYQARVATIRPDGKVDVITAEKEEFLVVPAEGDYVGHEKPADVVAA